LKKLALILAVSLTGLFAHAETTDVPMNMDDVQMSTTDLQPMGGEMNTESLAWACKLGFKGTAKGFKLIFGKFKTVAYGTLTCTSLVKKYVQKVKVEIGHSWIGATAGIGWFKLAGISTTFSVLNCDPSKILGKYITLQANAGIGGGVGAFTAVKIGFPQITMDIALAVLKGFGVQAGIEGMRISAVEDPVETPVPAFVDSAGM
jgi:hypothetical protein